MLFSPLFHPLEITHHAGQGEKCGLDLSHVPTFKQVIGLKYVIGLQAIGQDCFDEVPNVLQLEEQQKTAGVEGSTRQVIT